MWPALFILVSLAAILGNTAFLLLGSTDLQHWNSVGSFSTVKGACVVPNTMKEKEQEAEQVKEQHQGFTVRKRSRQQELVLQIQHQVRKRSHTHAEEIILPV